MQLPFLKFLLATVVPLSLLVLVANPVILFGGFRFPLRAKPYFKPAMWLTLTAQLGLGLLLWAIIQAPSGCWDPVIDILVTMGVGLVELALLLEQVLLGAMWWWIVRQRRTKATNIDHTRS